MRYLLPTAEVYKDLFVDLSSGCRRMAMATTPRRATQQRRQLLARRTHHHHAGTTSDLLPFLVRGCPLMLLLMWSGYSLYFFTWTNNKTNDYIKNGVIHAYRKGMIEKSSIMSTNKKYFNHTVSVFHPTEWYPLDQPVVPEPPLTTPPSITNQTDTRRIALPIRNSTAPHPCPRHLQYVTNHHAHATETSPSFDTPSWAIPRQIFQTSKSHCVVPSLTRATQQWKDIFLPLEHAKDYWNYYLFDDTDLLAYMHSFAKTYSTEFPLLVEIVQSCLEPSPNAGTLLADLWRYCILWEHGGIYADMDAIPNPPLQDFIVLPQDNGHYPYPQVDALFVVEQYHLLSQYFLAAAPRHPLLWYTIHYALRNILLSDTDVHLLNPARTTGPHALHEGFRAFLQEASPPQRQTTQDENKAKLLTPLPPAVPGQKPVGAGIYFHSRSNRSVTVLGVAEHQNEYVNRDIFRGKAKGAAYDQMGMKHFSNILQEAKEQHQSMSLETGKGLSCRMAIQQARRQRSTE